MHIHFTYTHCCTAASVAVVQRFVCASSTHAKARMSNSMMLLSDGSPNTSMTPYNAQANTSTTAVSSLSVMCPTSDSHKLCIRENRCAHSNAKDCCGITHMLPLYSVQRLYLELNTTYSAHYQHSMRRKHTCTYAHCGLFAVLPELPPYTQGYDYKTEN
jgi:hypothetical protein